MSLIYHEIIIYNCYISEFKSFKIYVIFNGFKLNTAKNIDQTINIPYEFNNIIKNVYYQIIQNRFNLIKKKIIKLEHDKLWNSYYLV